MNKKVTLTHWDWFLLVFFFEKFKLIFLTNCYISYINKEIENEREEEKIPMYFSYRKDKTLWFEISGFLLIDRLPWLFSYLPVFWRRMIKYFSFARVLVQCEIETVRFRLWTQLVVFIYLRIIHSPTLFLRLARIGLCGLVAWFVTSVKATGHG